jgi:hypothetical protein
MIDYMEYKGVFFFLKEVQRLSVGSSKTKKIGTTVGGEFKVLAVTGYGPMVS